MNARRPMPVQMLVLCALFTALTAVCAQLSIPTQPVPICMALFAVELCGALLEKRYAVLAVGAYVLLGLIGVPVYANFTSGAAELFGLTGGYLLGYVVCAWCIAWIVEKWGREAWKQAIAMALGVLACYALGTAWFMALSGRRLGESLALCVAPFLLGDAAKIALAVLLSRTLYKPMLRAMRR